MFRRPRSKAARDASRDAAGEAGAHDSAREADAQGTETQGTGAQDSAAQDAGTQDTAALRVPLSPRSGRRHGRRAIRSSITGPGLRNPHSRFARFEADARGVVEFLQHQFAEELHGVNIGFQTVPSGEPESSQPLYYSINRATKTIMLYRMPIQRAKVLHVDDDLHRRMFIEHCVYLAVCEYLGREPWELMPGYFDHF